MHFIAVYRVNLDKPFVSMIKLKGLYPSVNLTGVGSSVEFTDYWFGNHLLNSMARPSLVNYKNQEVEVKVTALKLSNYIEELVREEFPLLRGSTASIEADSNSIDYELCLHQDFLYMLRQRKKS